MLDDHDLRELVKRVVGRALAERGVEPAHGASAAGVHVALHPAGHPLRPVERTHATERTRGRPLISTAELAGARDGELAVPADALVTELAREEARRRGIALRAVVTGATGAPGASGASGASGRPAGRLRIAVGADHGGFALKRSVCEWLRELGHAVIDLGTHDENPVDYPDVAATVARAVAGHNADLGICVDGAGIGSAIAANKIAGIRAALCVDAATARNAREHNHANVLTLGGKLARSTAHDVVRTFLATPVGPERHARRVAKITALEREQQAAPARDAR